MTGAHYPDTPRVDCRDYLHGILVTDPYRWLEDPADPRTKEWQRAQDALYTEELARLPGQDRLAARLAELHGVGTVSLPVWRGDRWFAARRVAGQEHPVLYTAAAGEDGCERTLIDPAALDPDRNTTLDGWYPDREGRLLAYWVSQGGTEESSLRVMDVSTGEDVDGLISRARSSPVAWLAGGKAFYYVRRINPRDVPAGEERYNNRVYLHRLGSPAATDTLVFGMGRDMTCLYRVATSADGRWLIISARQGTAPRNDIWIADLSKCGESVPRLEVVQEGADGYTHARVGRDGRLYLFTDLGAPRRQLVVADPAQPGRKSWSALIPQDDVAVLTDYAILDGADLARPLLLASWSRHAISEISLHAVETGECLGGVPLPGPGTVGGFAEHPDGGSRAWFSYADPTTPQTIFSYEALTRSTSIWARPPGLPDIQGLRTEQVEYFSADGTRVRMLILGQGDNGGGPGGQGRKPKPTILNGYGGFGVSATLGYEPMPLAWVETGGNYVVASLRGGGEEGEEWHRAGMREHKQNVFDDFYAAAERLIADGWTTPRQLCIAGGSNGGLLIGAAITQRPDLFAAALCRAPLLDMVRYERSGLGRLWTYEYGTATDAEELSWLLRYSPYHNVHSGTAYPAVLFAVFDADSRVDPMHARKMCAMLQQATSSPLEDDPVLLRRELSAGHGERAVSRTIALAAEMISFAARHTGVPL